MPMCRERVVEIDRAWGTERNADAIRVELRELRLRIVDDFDRDQRHYFVAERCDPPAGCSRLEREVLAAAARGGTNKEIAYSLRVNRCTVSTLLCRAMRNRGLRTRWMLAVLLGGTSACLRMAQVDDRYLLLSRAARGPDWRNALTDAEHEVAALAGRGRSNSEIAAQRGTSVRTVANQMKAILHKLSVPGRGALAARMAMTG